MESLPFAGLEDGERIGKYPIIIADQVSFSLVCVCVCVCACVYVYVCMCVLGGGGG